MDKKLLKAFDKEFGGKVKYIEDINDNYEFFGKVQQQLQNGQPIGRDIVVLTDYMAARWVRNNYAEPFDKKNIPNASNLVDNLASINYDPDRKFSLPYQSGATGVGYNIKKTGRELKNVADLFDPKFKGRVTLLSEPYDSASTVMLGEGQDPSNATIDQLLGRDREDRQGQPGRASSGASPATTTRPTSPRATCGSRSRGPATSSSSRATTRTCDSATSKRATSRSTTT